MGASEGGQPGTVDTSFDDGLFDHTAPNRPSGDSLPTIPANDPVLVFAGSDDPALAKLVDQMTLACASSLDIRSDVLWTEVPNGVAYVKQLLETVPERRDLVRVAFAAPGATVDELARSSLMAANLDLLADALERHLLSLNPPTYHVRYQPLLSLADRSVVGFESLIRAEAGGQPIDAESLIARATRGGWTAELDHLGRTLALQGVGPWLGEGLLFLNVMAPGGLFDIEAINRSIDQAIEDGLDPDQLVLEAVERNRYLDLDAAAAQIAELRERGVRIAVDDVGDGFSSLRVVSLFKPDVVKIAGHLVAALPTPEATAVVAAIVTMAHDTGAWVVAENIETEEQARKLTSMGVDWGQGLHLGPPSKRDTSALAAPDALPSAEAAFRPQQTRR